MDVSSIVKEKVSEIKQEIGDGKAIIALSGGVDSTVSAILTRKAIGDRLLCIYVETGFMRKKDEEKVDKISRKFELKLKKIDAKDKFLREISGVRDPEEKRRRIGRLFIRIFEKVASEFGADYLVQGTIAPDVIESKGGIKTHHNVGGVGKPNLKIVEPLRDYYKDEVREIAKFLDVPSEVIEDMPFPGPGLAVRIMGEVTEEKLEITKKANEIVEEEVQKFGLKPWQAFAVLMEGRATGVKGDLRQYGRIVCIRLVDSIDAMTAGVYWPPREFLERVCSRITSEIPEITRVLFDVTPKPPATIEFE